MAYASLSELKRYLGITINTDDVLLSRLLEAATGTIDAYCQRRFEGRTATLRHLVTALAKNAIILRDDLLTFTGAVSDSGYSLAPAHVVFIPPARVLHLLDSAVFDADLYFDVSGVWGYSASPPDDIVQACIRLAAWMYRQKDVQVLDTSGMPGEGQLTVPSRLPRDVADVLQAYRLTTITAV